MMIIDNNYQKRYPGIFKNQGMIESVLEAYGIKDARSVSFGNGLIHHTWKVITPAGNFILQKIQDAVFKRPQDIAYNIRTITGYLRQNFPDYLFVTPIVACNGDDLICMKDKGYFRMFPFVEGSHSKDIVQTAQQAYEAAAQFGKFTRLLSGFDVNKLKITIPGFHNLDLRYRQLQYALKEGNAGRISQSKDLIEQIARKDDIVSTYNSIHHLREFKLRATHHDTKISNVLFDKNEKAICVIDLDTVMAGYFISDVGDMMRTYLSPVSEEEKDFEKITIRDDFYKGIVEGYAKEMDRELSATESQYFFYAGMFMIYMQAIRFLTDHLNNDIYYGAKYDGQNFVRAGNQMALLERLMEKEEILK